MQPAMRRKDRQLPDEETRAILSQGEYGILSMSAPGNSSYGVPLNYVLWNNHIYFHCAQEGSKLDYLRRNNRVSFCVVGTTEVMPEKFGTKYESAIVSGTAVEVEGNEKRGALQQLIVKYAGEYIREGEAYIDRLLDRTVIVRITGEHMSGKARRS